MGKLTIFEPLQRMEIIEEIRLKTNYGELYLKDLSDEKLIEILKDRG